MNNQSNFDLSHVTVNGKPLFEHIENKSGAELRESMRDYRQSINRNLNRGGRSLAHFAPTNTRRQGMEKGIEKTSAHKAIYALLTENGKEFTTAELAKKMGTDARTLSNATSRLKTFILDSGDVDDIFKIGKRGSITTFKCIVNSIDNPEQWADRYYKMFSDFDRVRNQIIRENKKNGKRQRGGKENRQTGSSVGALDTSSQPLSTSMIQGTGTPIDVPINISITVSIKLEGETDNVHS